MRGNLRPVILLGRNWKQNGVYFNRTAKKSIFVFRNNVSSISECTFVRQVVNYGRIWQTYIFAHPLDRRMHPTWLKKELTGKKNLISLSYK